MLVMATTNGARYDAIADWYSTWVGGEGSGLIVERAASLLPASLSSVRVLDVACRHGRASRELARLGADVVGIDISAELIAQAIQLEAADPLRISYRVGNIAEPE